MIFRRREKEFNGTSAVDVVRALEREDKEYRHCGGSIRQYLSWSLNRLGDSVPPRDLDLSDRLEDEALALAYLLLLDEYGVGKTGVRNNMESLEFAQDATLSNGIYEVSQGEAPTSGDSDIAGIQEDLTAERERHLRLLAEFDNYRRRTKQERALAEETGKREVLLALLDVKDDVDRALLHIRETSDAVADGLRLIQQRFNNLLEAQGVTAFESEGQLFDPEIHEAITMIDGDGEQSGTVYSEHRRGYLMNGNLLRPARVAVLK